MIQTRQLDLDLVIEFDDWLIIEPERNELSSARATFSRMAPGPLSFGRSSTAWCRRRTRAADGLAADSRRCTQKAAEHLAMVFHKFLSGRGGGAARHHCQRAEARTVGSVCTFREGHPGTGRSRSSRLSTGTRGSGNASALVLPGRDQFSRRQEFERLSGPLKWNRQQGLYIYRADRLVQWGGWAGIRSIDEHTKLARASVDFDTDSGRGLQHQRGQDAGVGTEPNSAR